MKTLVCTAICFGYLTISAQIATTWLGGHPGQETAWSCPKNWNTQHTPDAFNNVFIPDVSSQSGHFPVIESDAGTVNALTLESGAQLTITQSGSLAVEMAECSLINGTLFNQGNFKTQPHPKETTIGRPSKKQLALNAQQYNTVLSATDSFDWR
jgi:hypothetical protein